MTISEKYWAADGRVVEIMSNGEHIDMPCVAVPIIYAWQLDPKRIGEIVTQAAFRAYLLWEEKEAIEYKQALALRAGQELGE